MRLKTPMLSSNLCNYSDGYIIVKRRIGVTCTSYASGRNKKLTFKNNASFRSWISKINKTFRGNIEGTDIAMSKYNLLEHSSNYSMQSEKLWNCYRDEVNDDANETMILVILGWITTR